MQCDKNVQLVKSIEKFPCLYNFNLGDYLKKDITDEAWSDVAKLTQISVTECKEKWKNLRYGLLRSLRLNPDGTVKKKYYLHDEMEFVLPFIKTIKHGTNIQPLEEVAMETNIVYENDTDSPVHPLCGESEILESPTKKPRAKYDTFMKKCQHSSASYHDLCDDSRKLFLLSLLPEINTLTEFQMRVFRRKVLTLIDEIGDSPTPDMSLLEWQKDTVSQGSGSLQNDIIKKERI